MKEIIKIIGLLIYIIGFNSCDSAYLDIMPEGQETLDDIFSNEITTGAYLNSCYAEMPMYAYGYNYGTNCPILLSDDAWEHSNGSSQCWSLYTGCTSDRWSAKMIADNSMWGKDNGQPRTSWDLFYRNIRRCNVFLSRIDNAVVPSEEDRLRWKAEARVLRAYYYMEIASRFGGGALIIDVLPSTEDGKNLKKSSFEEIADFVINECKETLKIDELPWRSSTTGDKIRMTKGIAAAIASRMSLYKASPLFCNGKNYWDDAKKITKEMLLECLSNGYELYSVVKNSSLYGDNSYYEYSTSSMDFSLSPTDRESIWIAQNNMGGVWSYKNVGLPLWSAIKAGLVPTQELVDSYPMDDGSYVLDLENPYSDEDHLVPNYAKGTSYDPKHPYDHRDPRFYATIFYNGAPVLTKSNTKTFIQSYNGGVDGIKPDDTKRTCTGYYSRKYTRPDCRPGTWTAVSFRMMRLAELYLNYAEAAAENGDLNEAINAVKPIRDRVKLPNIAPANKEQAVLMIHNERRIEFGFEENRYNDIRRWCKPQTDMVYGKHLTGMWIEKIDTDNFEYHRVPIGQSYDKKSNSLTGIKWPRVTWESKFLLHPIERSEAIRLKSITGVDWQNPGW